MAKLFNRNTTKKEIKDILVRCQLILCEAQPDCVEHFPTSMGIYFWFTSREGLSKLGKKLGREIDIDGHFVWEDYYLVYVGRILSSLQSRINWHINEEHTIKKVADGTLSTLRQTLGALLADDLFIDEDIYTQRIINEFMHRYLWVGYISDYDEAEQVIDDEEYLIKTLRPILNIAKGRLSKDFKPQTIYDFIKLRKITVRRDTLMNNNYMPSAQNNKKASFDFEDKKYWIVLEGNKTKVLDKNGTEIMMKRRPFFLDIIEEFGYDINIYDGKGELKTTQALAQKLIKIINENGQESVEIYNNSQSIFPKDQLLAEEKNIQDGVNLILINCSAGKREDGSINLNQDFFDQLPATSLLATRDTLTRQYNYDLTNKPLMEAYQRYGGPHSSIFKNVNWQNVHERVQAGCLKVVIMSGLYGLIEYTKAIIDYDLSIKQTSTDWGNNLDEALLTYIENININNLHCFLSNSYSNTIPNTKRVLGQKFKEYLPPKGFNQSSVAYNINTLVDLMTCNNEMVHNRE